MRQGECSTRAVEALAFPTPALVLTGLRPCRPGWVWMALLVFRLAIGPWGLRTSAFPCPGTDLQGSGGLLAMGAGLGAQNPNEISVRTVHAGKI